MREIAPGVAIIPTLIANAYLVGDAAMGCCRPPAPATHDWKRARRSVELLAALCPSWTAAGHGAPMSDAAGELARLAEIL